MALGLFDVEAADDTSAAIDPADDANDRAWLLAFGWLDRRRDDDEVAAAAAVEAALGVEDRVAAARAVL